MTSSTYEVEKSFWQKQEDAIDMHNRIDPIRDMQDTTTTFIGIKANEFNKETEKINNQTSFTDHYDSSYGTTVKIKVKHLSNICSFTPQDLFCCILVNNVKKAFTHVRSIQGGTVEFNEDLNIDLLSEISELQIAICKPAEAGADDYIISVGTVKLPDVNRKPEESTLSIDPTGVLTVEVQVLPLESVPN